MKQAPPLVAGEGRIGKQMKLPWSKAIEIAAKSIQVRFWRSMITMSSIVLAIAFLMSIWTSTAIVAALGLGPQNDLHALADKLERVRGALAATDAERQPILEEFGDDIEEAIDEVEDKIDDKEDELEDATGEQKKKLKAEIGKLQARIDVGLDATAPYNLANRLQLLADDLNARSKEIEDKKAKQAAASQRQIDAIDAKIKKIKAAGEKAGGKTPLIDFTDAVDAALKSLGKEIAAKKKAASQIADAEKKKQAEAEIAKLERMGPKDKENTRQAELLTWYFAARKKGIESKKTEADAELKKQIDALAPRIKQATSVLAATEEERRPVLEDLNDDVEAAVARTEKTIADKTPDLRKAQADVKKQAERVHALAERLAKAQEERAQAEPERAQELETLEAKLGSERTAAREQLADLKKKGLELKEQVGAHQAKLTASANRLQLLVDHLKERREELLRRKGTVDTILQQERAGVEGAAGQAATPGGGEPAEGAETPARASGGGFLADFLSQMSPTDKWLAILALLVCFVGIVNAMFMTVQERFREIGTMKCLGALDAFIVRLFLLESAALGFIGTLAGILIGLLLSSLRQLIVYGSPAWIYLPGWNLLFAALLAAAIGLILSVLAAIFPARKAARMEPVEAMRVEE